MNLIGQLFIGLYMTMYLVFAGWTVYMVMIGQKTQNITTMGKLIYYHGVAVIISFVISAVMGLSFVFASVLLKLMGFTPLIGA